MAADSRPMESGLTYALPHTNTLPNVYPLPRANGAYSAGLGCSLPTMKAELFTIRQLLIALLVSFCLLLSNCGLAYWYTGARFDYQSDKDGGLVALHLAPKAGLSLQWSATEYSVWIWRGEANVRAIWGYW
jgi:hypothetical protein